MFTVSMGHTEFLGLSILAFFLTILGSYAKYEKEQNKRKQLKSHFFWQALESATVLGVVMTLLVDLVFAMPNYLAIIALGFVTWKIAQSGWKNWQNLQQNYYRLPISWE